MDRLPIHPDDVSECDPFGVTFASGFAYYGYGEPLHHAIDAAYARRLQAGDESRRGAWGVVGKNLGGEK